MEHVDISTVEAFCQSLRRLEVACTRTAPEHLGDVLRAVAEPPVVIAGGLCGRLGSGMLAEMDVPLRPTVGDVRAARTGVTEACLGVADYGSLLLEGTPDGAEPISLFPETHIAVLRAEAVVPDMPAAFRWLAEALRAEQRSFIFATGPSATADMGALVRGAHGPKTVHVILVKEQ